MTITTCLYFFTDPSDEETEVRISFDGMMPWRPQDRINMDTVDDGYFNLLVIDVVTQIACVGRLGTMTHFVKCVVVK